MLVWSMKKYIDCNYCEGTGFIFPPIMACPYCGGSGREEIKDEE